VAALLAALKRVKVELQRVDGVDVNASALAPLLREAGFGSSPRGMVFWPKTPGGWVGGRGLPGPPKGGRPPTQTSSA